ncbi:MAG: glycosyltransferase family protein [Solirubrobacteraceae bacterium]
MSSSRKRIAVVTWTPHHRTDCLARILGGRLYEPSPVWRSAPAPLRYAFQALQTAFFLLVRRPAIVVFQNPPSLLGALLLTVGRILRFDVWADTHSGIFNDREWSRFGRLNRFVFRQSAGVIVHTSALMEQVLTAGGRPFVWAYPVLEASPDARGERSHILVTLRYASDEPVELILRAAEKAPHVQLICTGNAPSHVVARAPANCRFSGWVSRPGYEQLLSEACGVLCLTTREATMQTGGFEAVERALPLITSDWEVLREFHKDGAIFVKCDEHELGAALERVWADDVKLRQGAVRQRELLLANARCERDSIVRAMDGRPA